MEQDQNRRRFLQTSAVSVIGASSAIAFSKHVSTHEELETLKPLKNDGDMVCIASGNGLQAVEEAYANMKEGADTAVAIVKGVGIVEADPNDMSVGYGGLPNEEGVVQLDASVMHGPTHKAGSVGAIENILHPAQVALKVLQTTDHVMIVGEGAYEFARAHGFEKKDLLTEKARQAWLRWKQTRSTRDDWLDPDQMDWTQDGERISHVERIQDSIPFTYGTIHCSAVNQLGEVSGCTTTSGLSYKIPGRVGDSPIIGAGMYVDNDIGAAGATGRGEAVIQACGAYAVTEAMARGMEPTQACLNALKKIVKNSTKQRRLIREDGRPGFNVIMYALRKDGIHGAAAMFPRATYAIADSKGSRLLKCASLFD
ncbi:MAG: N(4)-(beta-N-acetylglucosaminyl)-L-asparaginase [Phycisphaerales bacterium]|nr:N(4)-(beta-N-acetylglucosaminyl)-L-asparaginase [Phycisphaerales bacterium]